MCVETRFFDVIFRLETKSKIVILCYANVRHCTLVGVEDVYVLGKFGTLVYSSLSEAS